MAKAQKFKTREEWLTFVSNQLRPHFRKSGHPVPDKVRFALGFTSAGYRSKAIGECWTATASGDKTTEIFIKPDQDDCKKVAGILAHELVHAAVGVKHGHKTPFKRACKTIGLEGKATQALPGKDMQRAVMDPILKLAGPLPHKKMSFQNGKKKQTTRLLKCTCTECGYVARVSAKWVQDPGPPYCGIRSHGRMVCEALEDDDGEE